MLDQLLGPCNPGTNLVSFEVNEIQIVALLAPCKEIVVHLSQFPGDLVGLHEMVIEEAAHPGVFGRRKAVLEQQGGNRVKAGVIKAAVLHDIIRRLHYNVTPSRSTL